MRHNKNRNIKVDLLSSEKAKEKKKEGNSPAFVSKIFYTFFLAILFMAGAFVFVKDYENFSLAEVLPFFEDAENVNQVVEDVAATSNTLCQALSIPQALLTGDYEDVTAELGISQSKESLKLANYFHVLNAPSTSNSALLRLGFSGLNDPVAVYDDLMKQINQVEIGSEIRDAQIIASGNQLALIVLGNESDGSAFLRKYNLQQTVQDLVVAPIAEGNNQDAVVEVAIPAIDKVQIQAKSSQLDFGLFEADNVDFGPYGQEILLAFDNGDFLVYSRQTDGNDEAMFVQRWSANLKLVWEKKLFEFLDTTFDVNAQTRINTDLDVPAQVKSVDYRDHHFVRDNNNGFYEVSKTFIGNEVSPGVFSDGDLYPALLIRQFDQNGSVINSDLVELQDGFAKGPVLFTKRLLDTGTSATLNPYGINQKCVRERVQSVGCPQPAVYQDYSFSEIMNFDKKDNSFPLLRNSSRDSDQIGYVDAQNRLHLILDVPGVLGNVTETATGRVLASEQNGANMLRAFIRTDANGDIDENTIQVKHGFHKDPSIAGFNDIADQHFFYNGQFYAFQTNPVCRPANLKHPGSISALCKDTRTGFLKYLNLNVFSQSNATYELARQKVFGAPSSDSFIGPSLASIFNIVNGKAYALLEGHDGDLTEQGSVDSDGNVIDTTRTFKLISFDLNPSFVDCSEVSDDLFTEDSVIELRILNKDKSEKISRIPLDGTFVLQFEIEGPTPPGIDSVNATVQGISPGSVEEVILTETDETSGVFETIIALSSDPEPSDDDREAPYLLISDAGDTITAYVNDLQIDAYTRTAVHSPEMIELIDEDQNVIGEESFVEDLLIRLTGVTGANPNAIDTRDVSLASESTPDGIIISLTETGANTNVFEGHGFIRDTVSQGSQQIAAISGETITVSYLDLSNSFILNRPYEGERTLDVLVNGTILGGDTNRILLGRPFVVRETIPEDAIGKIEVHVSSTSDPEGVMVFLEPTLVPGRFDFQIQTGTPSTAQGEFFLGLSLDDQVIVRDVTSGLQRTLPVSLGLIDDFSESKDDIERIEYSGEMENDGFGREAKNIGDVNADGIDDYIIGNANNAGSILYYLYLGSPGFDFVGIQPNALAYRISGAYPLIGQQGDDDRYVKPLGDINGDGFDDFAIAYDVSGPTGGVQKKFDILLGRSTWTDLDLRTDADTSFIGRENALPGQLLQGSAHEEAVLRGQLFEDRVQETFAPLFEDRTARLYPFDKTDTSFKTESGIRNIPCEFGYGYHDYQSSCTHLNWRCGRDNKVTCTLEKLWWMTNVDTGSTLYLQTKPNLAFQHGIHPVIGDTTKYRNLDKLPDPGRLYRSWVRIVGSNLRSWLLMPNDYDYESSLQEAKAQILEMAKAQNGCLINASNFETHSVVKDFNTLVDQYESWFPEIAKTRFADFYNSDIASLKAELSSDLARVVGQEAASCPTYDKIQYDITYGDLNADGSDEAVFLERYKEFGQYISNVYIAKGNTNYVTTYPAVYPLSDLEENILFGEASKAISTLASHGDVNGDGIDDITFLVQNFAGSKNASLHTIFGEKDFMLGRDVDLFTESDVVMNIEGGIANVFAGMDALNISGDVNGDGVSDIVVSLPSDRSSSRCVTGKCPDVTFVVHGAKDLESVYGKAGILDNFDGFTLSKGICEIPEDVSMENELALTEFCLNQASDGRNSIVRIADVNGDGYDDIFLLNPITQEVSVLYGNDNRSSNLLGQNLSLINADLVIDLDDTGKDKHFSFDLIDVNGDTFFDVLIGDPSSGTIDQDDLGNVVVFPLAKNREAQQGRELRVFPSVGTSCLEQPLVNFDFPQVPYAEDLELCVQISNFQSGSDPSIINTIPNITIWSDSSPERRQIFGHETGADTDVYNAVIRPNVEQNHEIGNRIQTNVLECIYIEYNNILDEVCLTIGADSDARNVANLRFIGEKPGDLAGRSVIVVDVDGNGQDDVLVGAPGAKKVYVLLNRDFEAQSVFELVDADYVLQGADGFGKHLAHIGDINADGVEDFAIADDTSVTMQFGDTNIDEIWRGKKLTLQELTQAQISGRGDVNGDGRDDVVIRANEDKVPYVIVLFGGEDWRTLQGQSVRASAIENINLRNVYFPGGSFARLIPDINADGYDDIALADNFTQSLTIILGRDDMQSLNRKSGLTAEQTFTISTGKIAAVSGLGDVNNDGFKELLVNTRDGKAHVLFGRNNIDDLNGLLLTEIPDIATFIADHAFSYAADAGDINFDGYDDILLGGISTENQRGELFVLFGGANFSTLGRNITLDSQTLNRLNFGNIDNAWGFNLIGNQSRSLLADQISPSFIGELNRQPHVIVGTPGQDQSQGEAIGLQYAETEIPTEILSLELFSDSTFLEPIDLKRADINNQINSGEVYIRVTAVDPNDQVRNVTHVNVTGVPTPASFLAEKSPGAVSASQVGGVTRCSDGIDNDGDGFIDYPNDTGCLNPADNTETGCDQALHCAQGGIPKYDVAKVKEKPNSSKGFDVQLTETGINTGIFTGKITFSGTGSSEIADRLGVASGFMARFASLVNDDVFNHVFFVPGLPQAPVITNVTPVYDNETNKHTMQWDWGGDFTQIIDFDILDENGSLIAKAASSIRSWIDDGIAGFGLLSNTEYGRKIRANFLNGSVTSDLEEAYSHINAPVGVGKFGASDATISVAAKGVFSNLEIGNSGIQLRNVTTNETSKWQKSNLFIFGGLETDTAYDFQARARNAAGMIVNEFINGGWSPVATFRTAQESLGVIRNIASVTVDGKSPRTSNEVIAQQGVIESDFDKDGLPDSVDICPEDYNPDQLDSDKDGAGDLCDLCPGDPTDTKCDILNTKVGAIGPDGQVIQDKIFTNIVDRAERFLLIENLGRGELLNNIDLIERFIAEQFTCSDGSACPQGYVCGGNNICQRATGGAAPALPAGNIQEQEQAFRASFLEIAQVAPECSDGIDNDGDGQTDYPDDLECVDASQNDEFYNPVIQQLVFECSDGLDNDGDGQTDYPNDIDCPNPDHDDESFNPALPPAPLPACSDGIDNDGDSLIDFPADPQCDFANDNDELVSAINPVPVGLPECNDGIDNDDDSFTDYPSEPGCTSPTDDDESDDPVGLPPAPPAFVQCNDDIDNDGDGQTDYPADDGCDSLTDNDETDPVGQPNPLAIQAQNYPIPVPIPQYPFILDAMTGLVDPVATSDEAHQLESQYIAAVQAFLANEQIDQQLKDLIVQRVIVESAARLTNFDTNIVQELEKARASAEEQLRLQQQANAQALRLQRERFEQQRALVERQRLQLIARNLGPVQEVEVLNTTLGDLFFKLRSLPEIIQAGDRQALDEVLSAINFITSISGIEDQAFLENFSQGLSGLRTARSEFQTRGVTTPIFEQVPDIRVDQLGQGEFGAKVDIDPGSFSADTTVSITPFLFENKPEGIGTKVSDSQVIKPGSRLYEFNTSDNSFNGKITIKADDLEEGEDLNEYAIYRFNELTGQWEEVPGATVEGDSITVPTTHFSYYIIGKPEEAPGAPSADFSADITNGAPPLSVEFSDESVGVVDSYFWGFGDGDTSTAQNPIHEYENDGEYTVSLTVFGPGGNDQEIKTDYITVAAGPECVINADCLDDEVCQAGSCVQAPPPECIQDADCAFGESCEAGSCVVVVECSNDSDCAVGEVCQAGSCVLAPECSVDADCQANEICQAGSCTLAPGACSNDTDCAQGEICQAGQCVIAPQCVQDADCPQGQVCQNNSCILPFGCSIDADCGAGQICQAGLCILAPQCIFDTDCAQGETCQNNVCVAAIVEPEEVIPPEEVVEPTPEEVQEEVIDTPQEQFVAAVQTVSRPITQAVNTVVIEPVTQVAQTVNEVISPVTDNPVVEQASSASVPLIVTVSAVNAAALFSFVNVLVVGQSVIIQPLLYLFRRRRKQWGVVYDSLTKRPVDLAIVRLFEQETNRLVQTRITDLEGRYQMVVPKPGNYYIKVTKKEYSFPSDVLSEKTADGAFLDLYHGEKVNVSKQNTIVTLNIPLDSQKEETPSAKIRLTNVLRSLQNKVAVIVFALSAATLIIVPSTFLFWLLVFNVVFYALMKRYVYQRKPKSWGIIYDKDTKKPLSQVVMKIFDAQYNKLLESQVTDAAGRYGFLVGQNVFYVTAEKEGYSKFKTDNVKIPVDKEYGVIGEDISLTKGDSSESVKKPEPPKQAPETPSTPPVQQPPTQEKPEQPMTPPTQNQPSQKPPESQEVEFPESLKPKHPADQPSVDGVKKVDKGRSVDTMQDPQMEKLKKSLDENLEDIDIG